MIALFTLYVLGCALLLVAGVVEQRRHHRTLFGIPHRVVVNGIRGKSSITRLCAGALRGGGLVTVAKTTGSAARFISPDGEEEPVYRKFGLANIVEQIGIVRRAAAYGPDALVIECMAVLPDLQEVNERKLIRSTVCVISNVREDHLAEMGPTLDDVARSLARSMPEGGVCVTAERERFAVLQAEADRRRCRLVQVDPDAVTDAEMARFPWITFKENVAIALEIARLHGVDRAAALDGMVAARPDPGTVAVRRYDVGSGRVLDAANIFAANDPASTLMNVEMLAGRGLIDHPLTVVINCRPDRVERNGQMGELTGSLRPDVIVLIGEQTRSARVTVPPELADRVVDLGGPLQFDALLDALAFDDDGRASLVAVGNIHGQGEVLLSRLAALPAARTPLRASASAASRSALLRSLPSAGAPLRSEPPRSEPVRSEPVRSRSTRSQPGSSRPVPPPPVPPRAAPGPVERTRPVPARVRAEPVRPEPVRGEPVRREPQRSGPHRLEPVRAEAPRRDRTGPEPVRRDRTGFEPVRRDRTGPEPVRADRTGPEPVRRGRTGPEPLRADRTGPEPLRRDRTGPEPVHRDRTGPEPVRADRTGPEPVRRAPGRSGSGRHSRVEPDPTRSEPPRRPPVRGERARHAAPPPEAARPDPVRPTPPPRVPPPRTEAPDPVPFPAPRPLAPRLPDLPLPAPLEPDRRVAAGSIPPRPRVVQHPPRPRGASRRS